ncbi:MAG: hypothetical protein AMJ53_02860 [Gammaproteobacteria bacterium SG8_11]|nr:MAG: hypothetical protein AMJ53_02860 [Gammaproteobacteria bacterium SG8_11]
MLNDAVITLPRPHTAQQRIIDEAGRFNVVNCGRRFGKTTLGIDRVVTPETLPHPVGWFSPTYKMLLEVWREAVLALAPITTRKNVQERRIETVAGGVIEFWSLENPDAARGRKYRRVIIDEAAMIPGLMDAWQHVIRPALADYVGDAWMLSTPKGRNGFWQMYLWGQDDEMPDWASWTLPTSANPHIADSEIEAMRSTMPELVYRQEILAQFLEDAGGVFRRVMEAATATAQDSRQYLVVDGIEQGWHPYVFGVDWGQMNDFTAIAVIDLHTQELVHLDRFNKIDYVVQSGRLHALVERFKPSVIVAESNSMGQPIIERLIRDGLRVQPFQTTNATKAAAIDALALAFERGDLRILNDPILVGELQAYEMSKTPSGLVTYSAPEGMHDDTVIALALAWQAAYRKPSPFSVEQPLKRSTWTINAGTNGGGRWKRGKLGR